MDQEDWGELRVYSAGVLIYRFREDKLEVLLGHPGGPFWSGKDLGAWSAPKGVHEVGESSLEAAKREMQEETGFAVDGEFVDLGSILQPSGKIIRLWALEYSLDPGQIRSNEFTMAWPRRSKVMRSFPEIDGAMWFDIETARKKIQKGQAGFIDRLVVKIGR
jgi:predicted NUDIX family NTP pyrophosphohydrolase